MLTVQKPKLALSSMRFVQYTLQADAALYLSAPLQSSSSVRSGLTLLMVLLPLLSIVWVQAVPPTRLHKQ